MRLTAVLDTNAIAQVGLRRYLRTLSGRANDLYPVWDKVLDILYEAQSELFEREGKKGEYSKWTRLSPRYKKWKDEHYPGKPILELTGRFWVNMTRPSGQHTEIRERRRLTWGSDHKVSGGHDLGGIHAEGRRAITGQLRLGRDSSYMPAREPIRITKTNVNDIADVVVDHILDFDLSRPRQDWELGY